jgi:hypothetical protein
MRRLRKSFAIRYGAFGQLSLWGQEAVLQRLYGTLLRGGEARTDTGSDAEDWAEDAVFDAAGECTAFLELDQEQGRRKAMIVG